MSNQRAAVPVELEQEKVAPLRRRVLMVDDDSNLTDAVRRRLRRSYEITAVESPLEAIQILAADPTFVVIVSDFHMAEMSGTEFLAVARDLAPDAIRILFTGSSSLTTAIEAINVGGVFRFVSKPVHSEVFDAALAAASEAHDRGLDDRSKLEDVNAELDAKSEGREQILDVMDGGIQTVFQPIVRLADRSIVGHEALSRVDSKPMRSPDIWFGLAEELGLGIQLDSTALACALRAWRSTALRTQALWLNISPGTVISGLAHAELLDARHPIVLEITERTPVNDYDELRAGLKPLRSSGIRLAIDDVGAGYSSMLHVTELRPDIIKLDRSLITDIPVDDDRRAMVRSLIDFACARGINPLAEGIETIGEAHSLTELGAELAQGFYFGRPEPQPLDRRGR